MVEKKARKERSMFLEPETFDVYVMEHGSGWEGVHVQVKRSRTPTGKDRPILISRDAISPEEFDLHIDELIGLLNDLRVKGKRKIAGLKSV